MTSPKVSSSSSSNELVLIIGVESDAWSSSEDVVSLGCNSSLYLSCGQSNLCVKVRNCQKYQNVKVRWYFWYLRELTNNVLFNSKSTLIFYIKILKLKKKIIRFSLSAAPKVTRYLPDCRIYRIPLTAYESVNAPNFDLEWRQSQTLQETVVWCLHQLRNTRSHLSTFGPCASFH